MVALRHHVDKFNQQVELKMLNLKRNNSQFDGPLHQLLPAYLECPDQQFKRYIQRKQDTFDEGTLLTVDKFIQSSLYKYKTLVDKGTWQAPITNRNRS